MVTTSYLLHQKRTAPGWPVVNHLLLPAAIDMAGAIEVLLARISAFARRRPDIALGAALSAGVVASAFAAPRRRPSVVSRPR